MQKGPVGSRSRAGTVFFNQRMDSNGFQDMRTRLTTHRQKREVWRIGGGDDLRSVVVQVVLHRHHLQPLLKKGDEGSRGHLAPHGRGHHRLADERLVGKGEGAVDEP